MGKSETIFTGSSPMTNNIDRLPEIKSRHETEDTEIALGNTIEADPVAAHDDRSWLIAELEQTRSRLADAEKCIETLKERVNIGVDAIADNDALRAAIEQNAKTIYSDLSNGLSRKDAVRSLKHAYDRLAKALEAGE